jgi:hypothetical protein
MCHAGLKADANHGARRTRPLARSSVGVRARRTTHPLVPQGRKRLNGVGEVSAAGIVDCRAEAEADACALSLRPHSLRLARERAEDGGARASVRGSVRGSVATCGFLGERRDYAFRPDNAALCQVLEPGSAVWLSIDRRFMVAIA